MRLNGFLQLSRRAVLDFGWSDEPAMFSLFHHLLFNAAYKDCDWHGVKLKRGQVIFGRQEWAKRTGISEQSLRTCINRLKSTGQLTSESTNKFTILTIVNYEDFVGCEAEATGKSTTEVTSNQPATNQQLTTSEEGKEVNNNTLHSKNAGARENEFVDVDKKSVSHFAGEITRRLGPVNTTGFIPGWLAVGVDLDLDVIPTIDRIMAANPGKTYSLKYFEKPILESCAMRKTVPELPVINQGKTYETSGRDNYTIDNSDGTIVRQRDARFANCGTKVKSASDKWDSAWLGALEQNNQ